jgi:hypothetical protein
MRTNSDLHEKPAIVSYLRTCSWSSTALMAQGGPGPPGDGQSQINDAGFVRVRTEDVLGDKSFSDLGLPQPIITALARCGFERPSPVQQAAIPLGRLGSDLIVQAKSGTGKTVVFATIILERLNVSKPATQVGISRAARMLRISMNHPSLPSLVAEFDWLQALVIAPTREVAIQSEQVISRLAAALVAVKAEQQQQQQQQQEAGAAAELQVPPTQPTSTAAEDAATAAGPINVAAFVGGLSVVGDEKRLRRWVVLTHSTWSSSCAACALVHRRVACLGCDSDSLHSQLVERQTSSRVCIHVPCIVL